MTLKHPLLTLTTMALAAMIVGTGAAAADDTNDDYEVYQPGAPPYDAAVDDLTERLPSGAPEPDTAPKPKPTPPPRPSCPFCPGPIVVDDDDD